MLRKDSEWFLNAYWVDFSRFLPIDRLAVWVLGISVRKARVLPFEWGSSEVVLVWHNRSLWLKSLFNLVGAI